MNNVNINAKVVADNRKPISMIGANLGTQYFKAQARAAWPEFEKRKMEVENGGDIEFIINRSPRRYRMTGHDVMSVMVGTDPTGATKIYLNKDDEGEVSIPVVAGMEKIGIVTEDAIGMALRNDPNIIFSDPKKLAQQLNMLNNDEKTRLVALRDNINKFISQIDSAIAENTKKADIYCSELLSSTPSNVPGASAVVVTTTED